MALRRRKLLANKKVSQQGREVAGSGMGTWEGVKVIGLFFYGPRYMKRLVLRGLTNGMGFVHPRKYAERAVKSLEVASEYP